MNAHKLHKIPATKIQIENLQAIARPAWPKPQIGSEPPTVEDIVQYLSNVAQNRLRRIRDLERHIHNLCQLGRPQ